jgi:hypothetical protein
MRCVNRTIGWLTAALGITLALGGLPPAVAWERPHSDGNNSGFVDLVTTPAGKGSKSVPGLGTFAPGAGPVIAPDGTVYLGTEQGKLIALHADGSASWTRQLPLGQAILASPAIGADGSIYVIGVTKATDHRVDPPAVVHQAVLYKFSPGAAQLWSAPFPPAMVLGKALGTGFTSAPPNIWRFGGAEAIMVPAVFKDVGRHHIRLLAFSTEGAILDDEKVSTVVYDVSGASFVGDYQVPDWYVVACGSTLIGCILPGWMPPFERTNGVANAADSLPRSSVPPFPGAAIFSFAGGGVPWVIVADQYHDIVGYTFHIPQGLIETIRVHDESRRLVSAPMVLPDGHTLVAGGDTNASTIVFAGPNMNKLPPVTGLGPIAAAPTRTKNGMVVVVESGTGVSVLNGGKRVSHVDFTGQSIASAAASRTYVFVSTASGLHTYDADAQLELANFPWLGGGVSPPAIGPDGRVYAIASNILFIFPGPGGPTTPLRGVGGTQTVLQGGATTGSEAAPPKLLGGTKVVTGLAQPQDGTSSPQPASQTFQPPLTKSGKRLYACQDFDGHGCGAPVAASFCQQQGFAQAGQIDTQSEKVQAETLNGRLCDKKKCRVFEVIVCTR